MIFRRSHMKVAKFVAGGCVLAFGVLVGLVILGVWARGATETLSIEIDGVCIDAPKPGYSAEGGADRMFVRNADLLMVRETRADPPRDAAVVAAALARPGEFVPVGIARDQFVSADPAPVSRFATVTFDGGKEDDRQDLLAGIRFCPPGSMDVKP